MSVLVRAAGPEQNFTIVSNTLARDPDITHKTRGVMLMLLSHTEGWETSIRGVARQSNEGRDAIDTAITEAEEHGYLRRRQRRDDQGRMSDAVWELTSVPWHWPQSPTRSFRPVSDEPHTENPDTVEADPVRPATKKTKGEEDQREEDQHPTPVMSAPSGADAPQSVDQAPQRYEVPREAARLCHELARMIAENDYSLPSPGSDAVERWYTACDRLLRLGEPGDGGHVPDLDEALEVARWATSDEFWRANIRSAEKFRKQFNRLRLDMQRDNGGKANGWTGADYRRAAEQMRASR